MTAMDRTPDADGFRGRVVLALVLVGLLAFSGFAVLGVYAPEFRGRMDPGAHALSSSAVGFRGAIIMARELGQTTVVGRSRPTVGQLRRMALVQTPPLGMTAKRLNDHPEAISMLIILPKWMTAPDPLRPGFVRKVGVLSGSSWAAGMLGTAGNATKLAQDSGVTRPVLHGMGGPFAGQTVLPLGPIDRLQTLSGPDWEPVLVDAAGRGVLVRSSDHPDLYVLADPDLLNNQGLANLDTARAGMAILRALQGEGGVLFDVTLNGLGSTRSLARLALEPPWLAATLCLVAAAVLMGLHAMARFGATARKGRAIALGAAALVDNSAGLIRLARKEPALAPDYLLALEGQIAKGAGASSASDPDWLERMALRKGLTPPTELAGEAARARSREDLTTFARKAHQWRREMTRDGR